MKLVPQHEYLILKRELVEKTDGGILIPEEAQKRNLDNIGIVEAVGGAAQDWVQRLVGREVIFKQFGGNWMALEGHEFYAIHEDDIIATVER